MGELFFRSWHRLSILITLPSSSYLYRGHILETCWAELMEMLCQRLQRSSRKRELPHLSIATSDLLLMWVTTELCCKFPFLVSDCMLTLRLPRERLNSNNVADVSVVVLSLLHTIIIARNFRGYSHFVGGLPQKYLPHNQTPSQWLHDSNYGHLTACMHDFYVQQLTVSLTIMTFLVITMWIGIGKHNLVSDYMPCAPSLWNSVTFSSHFLGGP